MDPARISFERQVVHLEQKAQDHTIEENLLIFLATFGVEQPGHHGELDSAVVLQVSHSLVTCSRKAVSTPAL